MIALRYGTPPVVHRTGGLADTVVDEYLDPAPGTGFVFEHPTADGLAGPASRRSSAARTRPPGRRSRGRGMAVDFTTGTSGSAPRYLEAYRRAIALRRGGAGEPAGRRIHAAEAVHAAAAQPRRCPWPSSSSSSSQPARRARDALSEALAARGVDLRAIGGGSIGEIGPRDHDHGGDDDGARTVLEAGDYTFIEGESILAEVDDRPGGMAGCARARRRRGQHHRPPVPRPLGRPGDVHVRRRRSRQGAPDPRATLSSRDAAKRGGDDGQRPRAAE